MITQNLIIYKFTSLYHILEELGLDLNFNISFVDNENSLNDKIKNLNHYLITSNKKYLDIDTQFVLDNLPINIFKLVEKINIEFLKQQFNNQSEFQINKYTIDLNSRELLLNSLKLKLTEKEINTIIYISKSNKPISIDELHNSFIVLGTKSSSSTGIFGTDNCVAMWLETLIGVSSSSS